MRECNFHTYIHEGCGKHESDPFGETCGCSVQIEQCQNEGTEPWNFGTKEPVCKKHAEMKEN